LEADLVVNNSDKDNLADQVIHFFDLEKNKTSTLQHLLPENHKTRAFIKIQDGCRYHCTYCIVTTLRGEERSRPPQDIIGEIQHLEKSGIQEIVLTGVHTCGYGHDINTNLSALLRNILSQTQIPRIRLGSLEPWDLPEDFFKLFENVRLMPHLHLPLQSGSDHILKRMARRCRIQDFDHIVTQARNAIPDCLITTDIIVGFPGETNEHWQETMDYLQKTAFSHVHAFTYSPRPGTAAEKFSHPVNNDVKKQRMTELNTLMKKLRINLLKSSLKQKTSVLWEQAKQNSSGLWEVQGYTPNFLRVRTYTHTPEQLKNRIVTSWLDSLSNTQDMIQAVPEHHPLFIQKNR
jgi:threonylcarbamoyladenosine tRNA methylthiotransferase MtaB